MKQLFKAPKIKMEILTIITFFIINVVLAANEEHSNLAEYDFDAYGDIEANYADNGVVGPKLKEGENEVINAQTREVIWNPRKRRERRKNRIGKKNVVDKIS